MWKYSNITTKDVMIMSGWKLYVYGKDMKDSNYVDGGIREVCRHYDVTYKVATPQVIARNQILKPAWGVAVIYLHKELFEHNMVGSLINYLNASLGLYNGCGVYNGARVLNRYLSCRYDLKKAIEPSIGIEYSKYLNLYRGEYGEYNISNNPLPQEFINHSKSSSYATN